MRPAVDAVSLYGADNAGVRARVLGFLQRLGVPVRLTTYFGGTTADLAAFARSPHRSMAGEWRLRRLARARPARLLLSREASPLSKGAIEARLLSAAHHGVYDLDDALHEDVRAGWFELLFSKGHKAGRAAAAADVVLAGNDYLAEWAAGMARDVRVIPTCVEPSLYTPKVTYELGNPPRLLWLGTPSGERYLRVVGPALQRLHRETGATLTIIGDPRQRLGTLEPIITRVPWSLATAQSTIAGYDVGLMPLADTPYERGKCAYKLLEYGAAGLPAVASPVGVNASVLAAADAPAPISADDWYEALRGLIAAPRETRAAQGSRLRQVVTDEYTFERWLPVWAAATDLRLPDDDSGPGVRRDGRHPR